MAQCKIKRALISVSDKTGVVEFAKGLSELGVEIVSTGGTHKTLADAGVPVLYVSDVTGFPEILDGRVKTLHPAVHGGILARRGDPAHREALEKQGIVPIDLVAVNLYPFREVANRRGDWEELIENIDIGGPAMIRSAAKNHEDVIVLVHPGDYGPALRRLLEDGDCPREERVRLALKAFSHTAEYDSCIHDTLSALKEEKIFPDRLRLTVEKISDLRYGENPDQAAALYRDARRNTLVDARQLQGKELSYNNWLDADSAFRIVQEFERENPAAAIIKHTNPCGAALGTTIEEAFEKAYASDPVSAFGGIAAFNRPVTKKLAETLATTFWEVVIAPAYDEAALEILKTKPNLRLLVPPEGAWTPVPAWEWKSIQGGFLVQQRDLRQSAFRDWALATDNKKALSESEMRDLAFAWRVVKHVKSNAIVLAKDLKTVGIGAGQPNRVGAAKIALEQAGENARGAALASDAFFPFGDAVRMAAERGIASIAQPGGSLRDAESTEIANERGITMFHTGVRHFKH